MKFSQGLGVILGTTTLALVQYQPVSALTSVQVNDIAKEITVMIGGLDGKGSGVIIAKNGNTYTVLTANHVVKKAGYGIYELITHDGQKYPMESAQTLGKLDLALVRFTSSKNYPIAKIADSQTVKEGATVYNSGFPIPSSSNSQQRIYFFITAQITARGRGENLGYDLFLSGSPKPGISGGPILNDQGEVIGIYGKAEYGISESALARDGVQGIPTEKFTNLISNIQDNTQANTPPNNPSPRTESKPKEITVMIGGLDGKGSGVIIAKNGNTYTVLTANHVVKKAGYGDYQIITHDGQKYPMEKSAQTLGKLDLALVRFTSSKNYPIAKIADSQTVKEGATVYNSGFPIPSSSNNQQRNYFFIPAQITSRGRGENLGYDLFLSGSPRPGMSGGPILNDQGEVIGIYGKAEFGRSESALARDGVQGIPTEKFTNLISNIQDNTQANTPRNNPSPKTEPTPVTFEKLEALLKAGKWQDANLETWELMRKLTKQGQRGSLTPEDVKNFPRQELRKMDQLWVKYSNGKFGFSVQKQIWLDLGGKLDGEFDYDTFEKLSLRVGWIKNKINDSYDFTYTFSTNALSGHLPVPTGVMDCWELFPLL